MEARVQFWVTSSEIRGGQSGTGAALAPSFPLLIITPPLLHTHQPPPHEMCGNPDQAAHCHTLSPKLGASYLTQHLAGLRER
jgi:hypothetical protein